ncbi:MAG TPA: ATP-binding protein [Caulobacteraceae bacterium]|jgi:signal transduction histidine kinase/CheY-like chemotaxis protein
MPLRLAIMGAIGVMLWTIGMWPFAPLWFVAYCLLQAVVAALGVGGPDAIRRNRGLHEALSTANFALAGLPAWHLWTRCGELGVAAAVMFLCGMLVQLIVGCLGARRLFWFSAGPLIAYLLILPPLAWNGERLGQGLTVTACAACLTAYLAALWSGYQKALARAEAGRREALEARGAAERAAKVKSDFLATMSHEVRTPMNAVLGAAGLLRRTPLDSAQTEYVEMISSAGSVLMNVLNDVLDLSKIEAGKFQISPARADLHVLVRRCADLWRPQAEAAGLAFDLRIDAAVPAAVTVDAGRLSQILFNLLSNAVKFTASGEVGLALRAVSTGQDRALLRFTVSDTGRGIPPDVLPRLFDAFEQADPSISREFGGTGLGLAISQRLAALMGGRITVRSEAGRGSAFELVIEAEVCHAPVESGPVADEADAVRPELRILVAEDNPVNRKIVQALLSPIGAAIAFANNGVEALEVLETQAFDLVLMDIQMPVMDGVEATRRLRASSGPNAGVPVVALTANVMEEQCQAYMAVGMNGWTPKPIDPPRLLAAIAAAIDSTLAPAADQPAPAARL